MKAEKRNESQSWYFASCPKGLTALLEKEVQRVGIKNYELRQGGISLNETDEMNILSLLLQTRVATRIYKEVHSFTIMDEDDLYHKALKKWWHKIFSTSQTFKIETVLDKAASKKFPNSMYLSLKLKDAIADEFVEETKTRPSVSKKGADINFLLRIEKHPNASKGFNAYCLLDLVGSFPLSNRGYRSEMHQAPLKENLAAGIVLSTDWNPEEDLFIDPMCGSGTLLIEALLIKGKIAPSYLKIKDILERKIPVYSFQKQLWFVRNKKLKSSFLNLCQKLWKQAQKGLDNLPLDQFFASDLSRKSLSLTEKSLEAALIDNEIVSIKKDKAENFLPPDDPPGIIICNPPYGKRLGNLEEIEELYHEFGENLKNNFKGFRAYVFTSNPELRKCISLQTKERISLYNGPLECRLLKYELYQKWP